jgi:hypothetical protein
MEPLNESQAFRLAACEGDLRLRVQRRISTGFPWLSRLYCGASVADRPTAGVLERPSRLRRGGQPSAVPRLAHLAPVLPATKRPYHHNSGAPISIPGAKWPGRGLRRSRRPWQAPPVSADDVLVSGRGLLTR